MPNTDTLLPDESISTVAAVGDAIFDSLCPGVRFTPEDDPRYAAAAVAAIKAYRASRPPVQTDGLVALVEETRIAAQQLRALDGSRKGAMENSTGFSANAIAALYDTCANTLEAFQRSNAEKDEVLRWVFINGMTRKKPEFVSRAFKNAFAGVPDQRDKALSHSSGPRPWSEIMGNDLAAEMARKLDSSETSNDRS